MNDWLHKVTADWEIGAVLCSFRKADKSEMQKLATKWAHEVDNKFGSVKRGKNHNISQHIEKVQMLEFGTHKRGWHVNCLLNKPTDVGTESFIGALKAIWLDVLVNSWQADLLSEDNELFWCEEIEDGFRKYALKERGKMASTLASVDTANDVIIDSTLTIHQSNCDIEKTI